MKKFILLSILLTFLLSKAFCDTERLTLKAEINGLQTSLIVDTGSSLDLVLFSNHSTELRLDLKKTRRSTTAEVEASIERLGSYKIKALVIEAPPSEKHGGVVGWPLLKKTQFAIDWSTMTIRVLDSLPETTSEWIKWELDPDKRIPAVECTVTDRRQFIYFDTGKPDYVVLCKTAWDRIYEELLQPRFTLTAGYSPAAGGILISKVLLAPKLDLEGLVTENALIEWSAFISSLARDHWAMLSVAFLKDFEVIFDGPDHKVYMNRRREHYHQLGYNRLGAVFAPTTLDDERLIAYVSPDSPAFVAGIRSGDELVKVDSVDVTKWKTYSNAQSVNGILRQKPGTVCYLEFIRKRFLRKQRRYQVAVTLDSFLQEDEARGL